MFSEDSLVVYPTQGVGKIERIDHKDIGGAVCDFYIVRVRANNITLMVPVHNATSVGLRALVGEPEARRILDDLQADIDRSVFIGQNWNRRFREYSERLKSPDLSVVAEVLRELLLIGRAKELSFGERRLLEQAMNLVCGEISEALDLPAEELKDRLLSLYAFVPLEEEGQPA
ncbi:MAG: CarD family transcriptional regulator [Desulfovibrio sp.]|nr:CarD family transcriptional regulator [Desulfovibrio sp.]